MKKENQEVCPIHGLPLAMELNELTIINEHFEVLMAKCPKCKVIYIGQRVKKLARFTYNGKQYQYLPKLASVQDELKNRKNAVEREAEERKQEKAIKQELERRRREKELAEIEKNRKMHEEIKRLDEEIKRRKILEEEREIKRKQQEAEKVKKEYEEKRYKAYPFLYTNKVKIEAPGFHKCPVHKELLEVIQFEYPKENINEKFSGFYCPRCNCLYLKMKAMERFDASISKSKMRKIQLSEKRWKGVPTLDIEEASDIDRLKKESNINVEVNRKKQNAELQDDPKLDEIAFKLIAYQKYKKEIAEISAEVDGKERFVRVLTSIKEEDRRKCVPEDMLVREAETLGRELLGRIAHDQLDTFYAKGHKVKIYQYKVWPGQEHHLDGFTRFVNPEQMQDITIMSQKNIPHDSEEYESVTALVYCAKRQEPVYISVYYSKRQNRYFINDQSYREYSARYGLPYVHLVSGEYDGDMDYGNLRQYSELNLYGYTVAKAAEMTSGERQRLLQQLIDNGLMSKHQIVNHLEWLLHRQSGRIRMEDACDCWREDLRFVNQYKVNQQRKICGRFVYGKNALG